MNSWCFPSASCFETDLGGQKAERHATQCDVPTAKNDRSGNLIQWHGDVRDTEGEFAESCLNLFFLLSSVVLLLRKIGSFCWSKMLLLSQSSERPRFWRFAVHWMISESIEPWPLSCHPCILHLAFASFGPCVPAVCNSSKHFSSSSAHFTRLRDAIFQAWTVCHMSWSTWWTLHLIHGYQGQEDSIFHTFLTTPWDCAHGRSNHFYPYSFLVHIEANAFSMNNLFVSCNLNFHVLVPFVVKWSYTVLHSCKRNSTGSDFTKKFLPFAPWRNAAPPRYNSLQLVNIETLVQQIVCITHLRI